MEKENWGYVVGIAGGFFDLKLLPSLLRNATSLGEGGLPGPKQGERPPLRGGCLRSRLRE